MHLTIYLNILHYITTIGFQTTIKVMQIMYTTNLTSRSIEKFCWYSLCQWIITFLLVTTDKVVLFLHYHTIKFWYLVWRILQVSIHRNNNIALSSIKATVECRTLTIVTTKLYSMNMFRIFMMQILNDIPAPIFRAIIDKYYFISEAIGVHHTLNPRV